jgi:FkbM family methyltransferase
MKQKLQLWLRALRARLSRKIVGPYVRALVVTSGDLQYAVDPEDFGVGWRLRKDGHYGLDEVESFKPYINPQSTVLVVGSHIGTLALPLSRVCREVVAIEANPQTFGLLITNIQLNGITNCRALNIAASNREEDLQFLLNRVNSGGSKRMPVHADYRYTFDKPAQVTVKAHALDTFLAQDRFDFIFMDIEGSEYFALAGMPRLLGACKTLVVEFIPHHLANVSGVTVQQFAQTLLAFESMTVPSKGITVGRDQMVATLEQMVARDESDAGLIFTRPA